MIERTPRQWYTRHDVVQAAQRAATLKFPSVSSTTFEAAKAAAMRQNMHHKKRGDIVTSTAVSPFRC